MVRGFSFLLVYQYAACIFQNLHPLLILQVRVPTVNAQFTVYASWYAETHQNNKALHQGLNFVNLLYRQVF